MNKIKIKKNNINFVKSIMLVILMLFILIVFLNTCIIQYNQHPNQMKMLVQHEDEYEFKCDL